MAGNHEATITEYGAAPGDTSLDTAAIQKAIDAVAAEGGGIVRVPRGEFVSGSLVMKSGVRLLLERGAVLRGSANHHDYAGDTWNKSFIQGAGITGFSIEGEGRIDGADCKNPDGEEGFRGPHGILLTDCRDFAIRGVTIERIGNYAILCYGARDMVVDGVTVRGGHDGVHVNKSEDIVVRNCDFRTGDDAFAGCDNRRITVSDCKINSSCNGFRFGCDGLTVERCRFWGPGEAIHQVSKRSNMISAFVHFAPRDRNPTIPSDNWLIRDCEIDNAGFVYGYDNVGGLWQQGQPAGRVRLVSIKATRLASPISIRDGGAKGFSLELENVDMSLRDDRAGQPLIVLDRFGSLSLRNVSLRNDGAAPVLNARDGEMLSLDGVTPELASRADGYVVDDVARVRTGKAGSPGHVRIESFEAGIPIVAAGGHTTLTWKTHGATSVEMSPEPGRVGAAGAHAVIVDGDETYRLRASGADGSEEAWVTVRAYRAADPAAGARRGLMCRYYEGDWDALPDFDALQPVSTGTVTKIDLSRRRRDDHIGFVFTGYVSVPAAGVYTFYTASDDGSALFIGDRKVVDNDGLHGMVERSGSIALGAGPHPLRIEFFEKAGGEGLKVEYRGADLPRGQLPLSALTH